MLSAHQNAIGFFLRLRAHLSSLNMNTIKKAHFPPNSRIGAHKLRILFAVFCCSHHYSHCQRSYGVLCPGQITIDGNKNCVFLSTWPSFDVFFFWCSFCSSFSDHFSCSLVGKPLRGFGQWYGYSNARVLGIESEKST